MNTNLSGKILASAVIATAALGAFAFARKNENRSHTANSLPAYPDTSEMELLSNVEPGELSPKGDLPTDPATQN